MTFSSRDPNPSHCRTQANEKVLLLWSCGVEIEAGGAEKKQTVVEYSNGCDWSALNHISWTAGMHHPANSAAGTHDILYTKHTHELGLNMESGAVFLTSMALWSRQ